MKIIQEVGVFLKSLLAERLYSVKRTSKSKQREENLVNIMNYDDTFVAGTAVHAER